MNLHQYKDYTATIKAWESILDENLCLFIGRTDGPSDNIFTNTALKVIDEIKDKKNVLVVGTSFCALQKHIIANTDINVESVVYHNFDLAIGEHLGLKTYSIPSGIIDIPAELERKHKRYDTVIFLDSFSSQTYTVNENLIEKMCNAFSKIADEVLIFETISTDEFELESHDTQATYWSKEHYEKFFSNFALTEFEAYNLTDEEWLVATYDYWMKNIEKTELEYVLDPNGFWINEKDRLVVQTLKEAMIKLRNAVEQDYIKDVIQLAKLRFVVNK